MWLIRKSEILGNNLIFYKINESEKEVIIYIGIMIAIIPEISDNRNINISKWGR